MLLEGEAEIECTSWNFCVAIWEFHDYTLVSQMCLKCFWLIFSNVVWNLEFWRLSRAEKSYSRSRKRKTKSENRFFDAKLSETPSLYTTARHIFKISIVHPQDYTKVVKKPNFYLRIHISCTFEILQLHTVRCTIVFIIGKPTIQVTFIHLFHSVKKFE